MILTGPEIVCAREAGDVSIEPFSAADVNPNSYNYHLGERLVQLRANDREGTSICIPGGGLLLMPGNLYLGATHERIGSRAYVTTLLGRSSVGRLGIFVNATADLGHMGSQANWTLEISVVQPIYIYPRMRIGQVAFWVVDGLPVFYKGLYLGDVQPEPSKDPLLGLNSVRTETGLDPVG